MITWKHKRTAWAAAVAAALALCGGPVAAAESRSSNVAAASQPPAVSVVGKDRGAYRIQGSFRVEIAPALAWGVLTDYDNLSSFVTSMRSSTAFRDESGRLLVTQQAVGRAGPFSRTLHVVLEVTEEAPARIAFRDVCGASFHAYDGTWTIDPEEAGSRVTYVLEARPRSSPPLFARSILASNARALLDQVRQEMLRRGRAGVLKRTPEAQSPAVESPLSRPRAATDALDQAHWKLKPPMRPSTSRISPTR